MRTAAQLLRAGLVTAIAAGGLIFVDVADAGGLQGRQGGAWGADRGGMHRHGGGSHGGHHHGGSRVWISGAFWWPGYYSYGYPYGAYPYPYAYAYPYPSYAYPYAYPYPMRTYPPPVGEAPAPKWYYCPDSRMYYPHVSACPSDWHAVPARPATGSQP